MKTKVIKKKRKKKRWVAKHPMALGVGLAISKGQQFFSFLI
jgi:hypothetical protein